MTKCPNCGADECSCSQKLKTAAQDEAKERREKRRLKNGAKLSMLYLAAESLVGIAKSLADLDKESPFNKRIQAHLKQILEELKQWKLKTIKQFKT